VKSAGVLCAVLIALGLLPQLGGFRYEAALVSGLVAPGWSAWAAFVRCRRNLVPLLGREGRFRVDWGRSALAPGALHAAAVLLAAALHDLVTGACELWAGLGLFVLGPALGTLLGSAFGTAAAVLATAKLPHFVRRRAAVLFAPLGPLLTALFGLGEFYFGPAIYAYDPFAGYFAGPLYDTIPFDLERLVLFRAGSLLSLLAFWLLGQCLHWQAGAGATLRLTLERSRRLAVALALALASLGHAAAAPALGLATTSASLARELSGRAARGVCHVHHSPWVSPRVAARVAWECAGHVKQVRQYFGLEGVGPPIIVHLFAHAEEKGRLMGARTTYLAKPWRREVYVQVDVFPHPVLGHELAHAVSADFGSGPFRVAGSLLGLVPDPGRVEGFAVAASPTEEGDATEREWARALLDLGQLPPSRSLFSLGFLGSVAVKSYTSAGAFVDHLHQTYGAAIMKRWYRGEDIERLTGKSWSALDADYQQMLRGVLISDRVRKLAQEIFSRPSIFGRRCPHSADRALERAQAFCPVSPSQAEQALDEALEFDPTRQDAEGLLPGCYAGAGDLARAEALLVALRSSKSVSSREKTRALVTEGDLAWVRGRPDAASAAYHEAEHGALTAAEARSLSLKRWALHRPEPVASAVRRWLATGEPGGLDPAARLAPLFAWYETGPDRAAAAYLLGLALIEGDPQAGRKMLEEALGSGELGPAFAVEAERRLLISACLQGDRALLAQAATALSAQSESGVQARRAGRLRERCESGAPP